MRSDLSVAEVAELTGLHPETIRRHARKGKLPAYRIGGTYLIRREAFDAIRNGLTNETARAAK